MKRKNNNILIFCVIIIFIIFLYVIFFYKKNIENFFTSNPKVLFKLQSKNPYINNLEFTVELYPEKAPITVENFLKYVNSKFYNGLIFNHIGGNIVAGEFYLKNEQFKKKKLLYEPIQNESSNGLLNEKYTIAMGVYPNEPEKLSRSAFFINSKDIPEFNYQDGKPGNTVFGKVIKGT